MPAPHASRPSRGSIAKGYRAAMTERDACALLKARFEAAGYTIAENQPFDEDGIQFEIDGFDATARVGYEYITDEAGDTWDVDDAVVAALAEKLRAGTLSVLVIGENDAPDATALARAADAFLKGLAKPAAKATAKKAPRSLLPRRQRSRRRQRRRLRSRRRRRRRPPRQPRSPRQPRRHRGRRSGRSGSAAHHARTTNR